MIEIREIKPGEASLAALHLYEKAGFVRTETKPNDTWADYHMTEEKWEYWEANDEH